MYGQSTVIPGLAEADRVRRTRILFLVAEDWYFCSHRLPVARAARDAGCEVIVATRVDRHADHIRREGFTLIPLDISRRRKNPLRELATVLKIAALYRRERPDLVHHVSLKPVIYGSVAAGIVAVPAVINALAGLGFVFSSDRLQARVIRWFARHAFRTLLNRPGSCVIVQNPDDRRLLVESETVAAERIEMIRGSGVDTARFIPVENRWQEPAVVTLVARMLRDKGIYEFVEAVKILRRQGIALRAVLVGVPDPENPTSIPEAQLRRWHEEGWVEWWGKRENIPAVWAVSDIAVLPSYREGLPLSLIEAAACARPIVTTDTPGCREIVSHGENGLLVPVQDAGALSQALNTLITSADLRNDMGQKGREMVEQEFTERIVVDKTLHLYRTVLGERWPSQC